MRRLPPRMFDTAGAVDGDALVYDAATDEYGPAPVAGGGGGGGGVTPPTVSGQSAATANAASVTVAIPATTAAGDLLIAFVSSGFTPSDVAPAGWQFLAARAGPGAYQEAAFFIRIAASGDAGTNVTFTFGGSYACGGSIVAVSGASALQEYSVRAIGTGSASTCRMASTGGGSGFLTLVFSGVRFTSGTTTSSYGSSIATSTNTGVEGCVVTAFAAAGGTLTGILLTHSATAKAIAGGVVKIRGI